MTAYPRHGRSVYTSAMLAHPYIATAPKGISSLSWRWAVVLVASVLLHLTVLEWAKRHLDLPSLRDERTSAITMVQLHPPILPAAPRQHPAKRKAKFKPTSKPPHNSLAKPARAPAPLPTSDPAVTSALTPAPPSEPADADTPAGDNELAAESAAAESPPPQAETKVEPAVDKPSLIRYKVDLPPSAELKYDVQKVPVDGAKYYGSGTISWQNARGNYQVSGEAHLLFITLFNFKSEGVLDDYGIAPALYTQKSMRRSETNTHFNRDLRNSITFSSSTISYLIKGGEQDRGSVMWELAGIGRGDREKFVSGAQIDLFVAGVRDGDIWSIYVVGQEEIEVGTGKTLAWHVVRDPRAGTYGQKIDIWLAPQYEWYPVKVRYTEKNGDYLDMSMSSVRQLLLASTGADSAR